MLIEKNGSKSKVKIIIDTNAFLVPIQLHINIFEELEKTLNRKHELILLSPIYEELKNLSIKSSPKMRRDTLHALIEAEKCKLIKLEKAAGDSTDDTIIKVAKKGKFAVFTNDKNLRKRLRDINVPVIYVRQKVKLEIDGRI